MRVPSPLSCSLLCSAQGVFSLLGDGLIGWIITGRASTASAAETTGTAIWIARLRMRFLPSVQPGTYGGTELGLRPTAETLLNEGNFVFAEGQPCALQRLDL